MIRAETAQVFRGGGRRWFTLRAACRAEARAKLKRRLVARGYTLSGDECDVDPMYFDRVVRTLSHIYERAYRKSDGR